ncbi:carboxylating nicotinate-nucleotide diphosphorylase [Sphingobacterium hungaricum]|uniref:Probable nicotinate-nucleotide pyrophosphorylase [carboxylating] n=1 Tax=Sphingobacterium hungaricum TaxID=2082723 RepID=A0A928V202_9SPHI|nr:carboxylating nicotinate-nucleotide diphosphorylase [Sphingobacterium hungaricum]MBE8715052.1 nicotinate-nucleotide diphosphorylase (carboxylating) [Sphingobacterium hungaricum]
MEKEFKKKLTQFIELALQEDIGAGDYTTLSTIPTDKTAEAKLLVKENGILAGVEVAEAIFKFVDPSFQVDVLLQDGQEVQAGDLAFILKGSIHHILMTERLVLNVMQRMSGIATETAKYAKRISHTNAKVLDTRKTTPLNRFLEKEAVKIGGGTNHRFGLYDMILIKDNHVDYSGGIKQALENAFKYKQEHNLNIPIEIEVRNFSELEEALAFSNLDRIMFDNFSPEDVAKAVELVNGKVVTEASGGITLETIAGYAEAGVDFISIGALTHSVKSLDLSLKAKLI